MMDRIQLLRAFVRTVELGSMSAAASELRVGQSTVSKWLAALEGDLGVTVLDRTTRAQRLTGAGEALLRHARPLVEAWDDAVAEVQAREPLVVGQLRVSLPSVFGVRHVVPVLGPFLDAHPDLELELSLADRYVNLVDEGFDVAIRVGRSVPSSLRSRRLASTPRRVVASPAYVDRAGAPERPEDLRDHACLVHTGVSRVVWSLTRAGVTEQVDGTGRVRADHSEAVRQLAVQGQGVALLAAWLVDDDIAAGRLVTLLPGWSAPDAPIRALLPPARHVPARVRALLDHLQEAWAHGLFRPVRP